MATSDKWSEAFEKEHGRKPNLEEFLAAKKNDFSTEADNVEDSNADAANSNENSVSENQAEWQDNFEKLNGRKPSIDEFLAAKAANFSNDPVKTEATQSSKTTLDERKQLPSFFQSNKKKFILTGSAVLAAAILGGGAYFYVNSLPVSVIKDVKVNFSGYDTIGSASLSGDYLKKIDQTIIQKKGAANAAFYEREVSVSLNKYDNIKNGEKIELDVTVNGKDNPIKAEKEEITVKNLKKPTYYAASDILTEYPPTFSGTNGFGILDSNDQWLLDSGSTYSSLSNGDKVTLVLSSSYVQQLQDEGKILKGTDQVTTTVSGLTAVTASSPSTNTDSSCYLTTATMVAQSKDFDDQGYELTTLRKFRDSYVKKYHQQDISYYYDVAPKIVKAINQLGWKTSTYKIMYRELVEKSVRLIEQKRFKAAYTLYKSYTLNLEALYL